MVRPSQGLERYATHPSRSASARVDGSSCAVTTMMGNVDPWLFRCSCSSRPDMPGRRWSRTRPSGSDANDEARNSSADSKVTG